MINPRFLICALDFNYLDSRYSQTSCLCSLAPSNKILGFSLFSSRKLTAIQCVISSEQLTRELGWDASHQRVERWEAVCYMHNYDSWCNANDVAKRKHVSFKMRAMDGALRHSIYLFVLVGVEVSKCDNETLFTLWRTISDRPTLFLGQQDEQDCGQLCLFFFFYCHSRR